MSRWAKLGLLVVLLYVVWKMIMSGKDTVVARWAQAIKTHEGWIPPGVRSDLPNGSRSYRNNNPGNLRVVGDNGVDAGGFGIFSSEAKGMAALVADLNAKLRKYPTATISQIMERYAPSSENDSAAYAAAVASALGVSVSTKLSELA